MELPPWDVRFDLTVKNEDHELIRLIERAYALSSMIQDVPIPPHVQEQLHAINIMRAVRGTTAIEGAQASTEEVLKIMAAPDEISLPKARERDEQEIKNANAVMLFVAYILNKRPDLPVNQSLIRLLHKLTTSNIDYKDNVPGEYRSHPTRAGDYLPPASGEEVRRLMNEFCDWMNSPDVLKWDAIVRALAAHFYLVSIHPFGDGNGRTSRAVESLLLYQANVNARGFYSLANYYYEHRSDYVWHLNHARFNSANDLTEFILFGARGLVEELGSVRDLVLKEMKLVSYRDYARETFQRTNNLGLRTKGGERLFHFLIGLGREPVLMSQLTDRKTRAGTIYRQVSLRTIQRDIAFLREHDLIRIEDGAIVPNLDVMDQFTAGHEFDEFFKSQPDTESQEIKDDGAT